MQHSQKGIKEGVRSVKLTPEQAGQILKNATEMAIEDIRTKHSQRYTIEANAREIVNAMAYLEGMVEQDEKTG